MPISATLDSRAIRHPINFASKAFIADKYGHYAWLRDHAPVYSGRVSVIKATFLARHDDCTRALRDPRLVRNRSTATGGRRMPFPMPRSVTNLAWSMILEDDPEHRRLRGLVQQAFLPRSLRRIEERVEALAHALLDRCEKQREIDLLHAYAQPIPVAVISEMLGITRDEMPSFMNAMTVLSEGMSGWTLLRTFLWDLRKVSGFVRDLIARKRKDPQDDILTGLIHAEEGGDQLNEDELVSMVFLLIIAGFETTLHAITNGTLALLEHPDQLERLRKEPDLMDSAVEEIMRYCGPIHATKPGYATEDLTIRGVRIPKGSAVMPLLASANFDPDAFEAPERFDVGRSPNRHLGFGLGAHYCLGAALARMETRIAIGTLIERQPGLRLAVDPSALKLQMMPLWHRYERLPVVLGPSAAA